MTTIEQWNDDLLQAAGAGDLAKVRALLDAPATRPVDVNVQNSWHINPLYLAAKNGHTDIVRLLPLHGAEVNALGEHDRTPLDIAKKQGHPEKYPKPGDIISAAQTAAAMAELRKEITAGYEDFGI